MQSIAMVNFTTSILLFSLLIIALLQLCCCHKAFPNVSCIARERRALLQLRSSLVDNSNRLSSWSGEDCCNWEGVGCSKSTGHVVKLDLQNPIPYDEDRYYSDQNYTANYVNNQLGGEVNPSLLSLEHLRYLDLSKNDFIEIQIPKYFGLLKNLRYLNLSNSYFTGKIPHDLGNLSRLQHLDLSRNDFDYGFIAKSISWVSKFSSLKSLDLSYANLSGTQDWFQAINMLPSLMSLKLVRCTLPSLPNLPHDSYFTGKILHDLGNLSRLQHLDLSRNDFDYGFIAKSISWVSKLSSLKSLDLSYANLSGTQDWFQAINMLPSLTSLKLAYCGLPSLPNLPRVNLTSLALLDLSENDFNSTIPLWLCNMTSLKHLDLSWNSFHGPIPDIISQLISLTSLHLSSNQLRGPLPNSFSTLSSLTHFDLSYNSFGGSLPLALLRNLTSLMVLDLPYNKFQGEIPNEIGYLRQLIELHLSGNELNGTISSNLGLLRKLEVLDISYNSLIGEISEVHFEKMKKLKYLFLSSNSLTLKVRSSWIPPFQLQSVVMDSVKIGPCFPSWLETQKNLYYLSMSNASISDNIPNWFEIVHSQIFHLDLSFNNITGKVPNFKEHPNQPITSYFLGDRSIILSSNKFEALPNQFPSDLQILDLSNNVVAGPIPLLEDLMKSVPWNELHLNDNYFNGSIPEYICYIRTLKILDLSNNQLSGRLPLCLGNLGDLFMLSLANNSLYGQIPSSLGYIELLQSLHLNDNKFHGELPLSMQYLKNMQFLDLGKNELEGIIPSWIGKHLLNLRILRLQSNKFYGDVSLHLCQLSNLQVLNLAQNNLTGCIPGCFNNLSAMRLNDSHLGPFQYYTDGSMQAYRTDTDEKLTSFMIGRELVFSYEVISYLTLLDLSQNNFTGRIPEELMDLAGLRSLNLSRNSLSGKIPEKIGNLRQLISLDLSMNELSGSIPPSLANLNFLSYLNLSSNKLLGPIPTGNQLQTLNDPSIYAGNSGLCGKPLSNNCSNEKPSQGNGPTFQNNGEKESSSAWFFAGLGPGFGVGFLGIFSILLLKKSWRRAYFQFAENFSNNTWVWIALKTSKP